MTSTFNRRLDNAAIFAQIVLGLAVFGSLLSVRIVGITVSVVSIWIFVYRPGHKALLASQQQRRYERLCAKMGNLSDTQLADEYGTIGEKNSEIPEFICRAAENAEHHNHNSAPPHQLRWHQRALCLIAGS